MGAQTPSGNVEGPLSNEGQPPTKAELQAAILSAQPFTDNPAIEALFTYHEPEGDDPGRYLRIRECARTLAYVIDQCCPESADRTTAIRKLSEAVMCANAAIARKGAGYR